MAIAIEAYPTCGDCGNHLIPGTAVGIVGYGSVCVACRETYVNCDECSAEVSEDDMQSLGSRSLGSRSLCADCYSDLAVECDDCGDDFATADGESDANTAVCRDCYDASWTYCDDCESLVKCDETVSAGSGSICESCYDNSYFTCESCSEVYHDDDCYRVDSSSYCRDCYQESYFNCDDCGADYHRDYAYCRDSGVYCESCDPGDDDEPGGLHSDSYSPSIQMHGAGPHRLGVELEIDGGDLDCVDELSGLDCDESTFWMTRDGSLSASGIEITTHPLSADFHKSEFPWDKIASIAVGSGYKSHDARSCGLHIHLSRAGLDSAQQRRIGLFVYSHRPRMVRFARREASWGKFKSLDEHRNDFDRSLQYDRYEAVNYQNRDTLEFRLFKGTLKVSTILASIQFVDALARWVGTVSDDDVTTPESWSDFCDFATADGRREELATYLLARNIL